VRLLARGALEVDDSVGEQLVFDGPDRCDEWLDPGGSPGEAAREGNQNAGVLATSGAVLGRDTREVADVFGQDDSAARDRGAEDLCVGAAAELELHDGDSVEPDRSKALGQRGWVHLIDEELHRASAAVVSLW
jgi:hypothetical protein